MRETFAATMDTSQLSGRRGIFITRVTLIILCGLIFFTLLAVGIIAYNIAGCSDAPASTLEAKANGNHCGGGGGPPDFVTAAITTGDGGATFNDVAADSFGGSQTNNVIALTPSTTAEADQSSDSNSKFDARLPRSVVPVSYDIRLVPFLIQDNFTFNGEVSIVVDVVADCTNITLHVAAITVHEVKLNAIDGLDTTIDVTGQRVDAAKQFLIIETGSELTKGSQYRLYIKYEGVLNEYLQGFYRSSYRIGNETRWLATTQFQPTDCRRAFPSFDEPALKAKFRLSIARPANMISLSNMPKKRTVPIDEPANYLLDEYEESIPMSTYLVAFVVSDYKSLRDGQFAVWARPDAIHSAKYALSVGVRVLNFLERFFNLSYPLPKVDMVALPDFSSGAMENFGLITYRETAMLYEEGVSAANNKQRVAIVVAHELAHQWFGNLVTPAWWTDLWLNEGFASYMEYVGVDAVEPSWKSMDQFVVNEIHNVFSLDALSTSHPVSIKVENPEEINEIFDRISYAKGAAIIRMMAHFLTDDVFRQGLTNYLRDRAFQSADQDDLWHFLTEAARTAHIFDDSLSVKEIMDTWTLQTGFPVVYVTRDYDGNSFRLKQERFVLKELEPLPAGVEEPLWWVPITFTTRKERNFKNTRPTYWMKAEKEMKIYDDNVQEEDWLILNVQETGYYRVNYDEHNWDLISKHLQDPKRYKEIAPTNRAQLLNDALNLARAGLLDYRIALDVTKYLAHEDDYVPWKAATITLNFLDMMLVKTGEYALFKEYYLHLLRRMYDKVGFEDRRNSTMLEIYQRSDILSAACQLGMKECIDNSIRQYHMWIHEANPDINNPISPNLKGLVYCIAIKYGDEMEWQFAYERFKRATVSTEKEILLSALGCSRETWILSRFLSWALTDKYGIRKQDVFRVFNAVSNTVIGQPVAFNFIKSNWKKMRNYFGDSMSNLNTILKYSTKRLNTQFELDELKSFARTHLNDTGRVIHQAIENTEASIKWMEKNQGVIVDWLTRQVSQLEKNEL